MTKYQSKTPFGRRYYELHDVVLTAQGEIPLRGRFEVSLSYRDMDPQFEKLWLRSYFMTIGIWFFAAGLIGYLVETAMIGMDGWSTPCLFTLMWAFVGAFLIFVGLRQYEILRFKTKAGVPVLDVFADGPSKASFAGFRDELIKRVAEANAKSA